MLKYFLYCCAALLISCSETTPAPDPSVLDTTISAQIEAQSGRLNVWFDEQFEQQLDFNPQLKTQLGDKSDYDKLNDVSEAASAQQLEWRRNSVAQMQSEFDYALLDEETKTSWDLWVYLLERDERSEPFQRHGYIFGRGGPHASIPNFMINYHNVDDSADMHAYLARLRASADVMNQYLTRSRRAVEDGIRQPRFNYDYAIAEIARVSSGFPFTEEGSSPLWTDIQTKLATLQSSGAVSAREVEAFTADARAALLETMKPAYDEVLAWLQSDRMNASADALGAWALPEGEAYYNNRLSIMTTLDLSADEIHDIGLAEVARIRTEMDAIKEAVNFDGTLAEFFTFVREDDQFYLPDTDEGRQAYLDMADDYLSAMNEKLPEYFGILPKADLVVKRVEAFREQDGAAQHYASGTPDGSRPGVFYAHLSDMRAMPKYQLEVISFHEGNPGHHMQISIQQELTEVPRFRTQARFTAFSEGWGLYSEKLSKEMGFYEDLYSDFGRLATEIWRAVRLVVDTGIHAKQWSEEQAVQYFLENSPQPEPAVRSEIQRYITGPGQATAYKIGMLKIQELRANAEAQMGDQFDIRGFHDTVLGGGALPMPVLEARVARWVAAGKARTVASAVQ